MHSEISSTANWRDESRNKRRPDETENKICLQTNGRCEPLMQAREYWGTPRRGFLCSFAPPLICLSSQVSEVLKMEAANYGYLARARPSV